MEAVGLLRDHGEPGLPFRHTRRPYDLVAYLGPSTSFTDSGLPSKATFYYVVTAVRNGSESSQSNEASAKTR